MYDVLATLRIFGWPAQGVDLHCYGVLIAVGFLLAISLAWRHGQAEGEDPDQVVDLCYSLFIAGLIGARLMFIITKLDEFVAHPLDVLKVWRGGLVWYGGFLGAVAAAYRFCRRRRIGFFKLVDLLIMPTALAHSFGRLGCLASGCCFGRPTDQPWGIVFPVGSMPQSAQVAERLIRYGQRSLPVHPTQLYEAAAELSLFFLLLWLRPRKRFHGQLFLTWLALYPVLRSLIEMFRGDKERGVWVLSTSQYISIGVGLAAAVLAAYFFRQRPADAAAVPTGPAPRSA